MDTFKPMSVQALKSRGHCCSSGCVHCPYGFTLKKFGLKFIKTEEFDLSQIGESCFEGENTYIVTLKDCPCASIRVNHIIITDFNVFPDYEGQGLSKEVVESYFFY
jgi:hypothetical protein